MAALEGAEHVGEGFLRFRRLGRLFCNRLRSWCWGWLVDGGSGRGLHFPGLRIETWGTRIHCWSWGGLGDRLGGWLRGLFCGGLGFFDVVVFVSHDVYPIILS
jgi:hypothetical protein